MRFAGPVLGLALLLVAADAVALRSGARRTRPVEFVVIHTTGGPTCDARTGRRVWVGAGTLDEDLRNIEANPKLGIHYMIDRDGTLRSSVPEERVAPMAWPGLVAHRSRAGRAVDLARVANPRARGGGPP